MYMLDVSVFFQIFSADGYSEPYQTPQMKRFTKIVNDFSQNVPPQMFDRVPNTPLQSTLFLSNAQEVRGVADEEGPLYVLHIIIYGL